jgi:hypothetical protein
MAFIVVYDANVLYPNTLRDLLIRISQAGLVQAKWTNEILDEMLRALTRNRPDIPSDKPSLRASSRLPIHGPGRHRTQRTCSASSNVTASSNPSLPSARDSYLVVACRAQTR